jgi:hypothetical protein
MQTLEDIKREWLEVKAQYSELIQDRVKWFDSENYDTLTKQNEGAATFFPKEKELFDRSEKLREKLMQLDPDNFHFGRKVGERMRYKTGSEYSRHGDMGFYVCRSCKGLFRYKRKFKANHESFVRCCEHRGQKKCGTINQIQWRD